MRVVQKAGRYANLGYDIIALPKNGLPLMFLIKPELLQYINPDWAKTAEQWLKEGPMWVQTSRIMGVTFFSAMVALTFYRLGYLAYKKEIPPSVAEYPKMMLDFTRDCVEKGVTRIAGAFVTLDLE